MTRTNQDAQPAATERPSKAAPIVSEPVAHSNTAPTKLATLEQLLMLPNGATLTDMIPATGWQQHSVRGAMAGALKKRGLTITSDKTDGVRRYHASRA